jgi:GNAT superfamily N-acetyltransferase
MPAEALAAWLDYSNDEYVRERIEAGDSPDYARERAAQSNAEYFPDGRPAEGQHVYQVIDDEVVGVLWIGPFSLARPTEWWVFDIEIDEARRGEGYGRATMLLAEDEARRLGATKLGLNVFGHNTVAHSLYTSLGYQATAINMAKAL